MGGATDAGTTRDQGPPPLLQHVPEWMRSMRAASRSRTVVLDTGTGMLKAGFAGEQQPSVEFPCVVGRAMERTQAGSGPDAWVPSKDVLVGAKLSGGVSGATVQRSYPMHDGMVQSWADITRVWDHAFYDRLEIEPSDCKILLTDPALNPTANRVRTLEKMFERYRFEAANMQVQALLTLYAQGWVSGLVVDSGDGVTHAVAVVDGAVIPQATKRVAVAGRHVSAYLLELLQRRGYALSAAQHLDAVREMKERLCFVAPDYDREQQLARETTYHNRAYTLPDGTVIRVGPERFMAPEALLRPHLVGVDGPGLAQLAFDSVQEVSLDSRAKLYARVQLSGGSTMYPGLPDRVDAEMRQLRAERSYGCSSSGGGGAWVGGGGGGWACGSRWGSGSGGASSGGGRGGGGGGSSWVGAGGGGGDSGGTVAGGGGGSGAKLRVCAAPNRQHLVFSGASVLAEFMHGQDDFWIHRSDWSEDPHRALQKCGLA